MTVVVERAILVRVTVEAPTVADVDEAMNTLRNRIENTLPRRWNPCEFKQRATTLWAHVANTRVGVKLWQ